MRKQYHFRKSANGYFAWDVEKLIERSTNIDVQDFPLNKICEIDENYWFDAGDEHPTCRNIIEHLKLVQEADLGFPIILCPDARLMDGMHRVAKAVLNELDTLKAVQFTTMPKPDYEDVLPTDLPY